MMPLLDVIRDSYHAAGLTTTDIDGTPGFGADCPVCFRPSLVAVTGERVEDVAVSCEGGCDRGRLATTLDYLREQREQDPTAYLPPAEHRQLRVLDTLHMITTKPPPLDWLADGVFCRGKLTLFGGREKRGKSLIQLALAVCMASGGGTVAGINVKPGRVLIVDGENGEREDHRRIRAMGLTALDSRNLTFAEARGFELREHLNQVAELATSTGADLVLLDSFRALWRGDERDEAKVAEALDPVRDLSHDTETAISVTHHAQKGGDEYRGSSAIGACIEWCVMLERVRDDTDRTRRRLVNPLARFAPEREDRWLQIRSGGDDGPVTLEAADPFVPERDTPVRDEVEAALSDFIEGCTGVPGLKGDDTSTPLSWSTADLARGAGRNPKDRTVRQAIQRLADAGVLYRNGDQNRWHAAPRLFDEDEP